MENPQEKLTTWLEKNASWNKSRTVGKTSLTSINVSLALPNIDLTETQEQIIISNASSPRFLSGLTCITCGLSFDTVIEQKEHFKKELHQLNLTRKLQGKKPLSELELVKTLSVSDIPIDLDNNNDSDNSEDSDNNQDSEEENEINDFDEIAPTTNLSHDSSTGFIRKQFSSTHGLSFLFHNRSVPEWDMRVSAGAFPSSSVILSAEWHVRQPWQQMLERVQQIQQFPMTCAIILRNGRFAGAIMEGTKMVIHKCFRRYTVRAKAGGGQSSYDKKNGKANSAGSTLRRYGERALKDDIQNLLRLWSGHLQTCGTILISAPKTLRSILFEEGSIDDVHAHAATQQHLLFKDDPRICFVPFPVGKPKLEEVITMQARCFSVAFIKHEEVKEMDAITVEDNLSLMSPADVPEAVNVPKEVKIKATLVPDMEELFPVCEPSREIFKILNSVNAESDIVQSIESIILAVSLSNTEGNTPLTDVSGLIRGVSTESIDVSTVVNLPESLETLDTPLHVASKRGLAQVVFSLLSMGADPSKRDVRGRTAYLLAGDKNTRDAFRRSRGLPGQEEKWDWRAAGVGEALTEDKELEKKEKEKEKKKRAQQRKKEQKLKEAEMEKEAKIKQEQQAIMAKKIEEARVAQLKESAGVCASCGVSLFNAAMAQGGPILPPLEVFGHHCCSSKCVATMRRKLAAEAAQKRMGF